MNPAESGSNLPLIPFPKYIEILPNIHKSEKQNTEESKLSKEDTINFIILRSQHTILKPEIQLILEIYENFIKDLNVVKYNLKTIETLETPEISDTSETLESFETQGNHDIKNRSEGSRNNGVLLHIVKETEFGDLDIPPKKGAYHVLKKQNMIHITALDVDGIFYGLQTFRQLVMFYGRLQNVPLCEIKDWPDFPIRGFMHDVGRNFIPINRLKQDIRIMAQYKLNTFHWHLTENEAWRIESKCFPELNNSQNHKSTRDPGKYYTYGEMRDFITYCNALHVRFIPEIDMPGHSKCFKRALGTSMSRRKGRKYLKKILKEFFTEIPRDLAPLIHIGSDEVFILFRKRFIRKMYSYIKSFNRRILMWSPGLPPPDSARKIIFQNWQSRDANKQNIDTPRYFIDSSHGYINNMDPEAGIPYLFFYKPCHFVRAGEKYRMGGVACLWPDVNVDQKQNIYRHNPVYPVLLTAAERYWNDRRTSEEKYSRVLPVKNYGFSQSLNSEQAGEELQISSLDPPLASFRSFENSLIFHKNTYFRRESLPFPYWRQSDLRWAIIGPFFHGREYHKEFPPGIIFQKSGMIQKKYKYEGQSFRWRQAIGATLNFKRRGETNGLFGDVKKCTAYALACICSPQHQTIPFLIGFDFCARSNRQYAGIPAPGNFDACGGTVFLNGKELGAPKWDHPESHQYTKHPSWGKDVHEIPFEDEEFYWTRPPYRIRLKKGQNMLLIKVPMRYKAQNWVITCIPLTYLTTGDESQKKGIHFSYIREYL